MASPEAVHPSSPPAPLWVHSLFLDGGTTVTLDTRPPTGTPWATSRYTWHCGYGPMVYGEEVGLEWRETHVDADGNRTYWHGGTDGSGPPQEDACASDSKPSAFNCLVDRTYPTVRIMGCPADGGTY